MMARADRLIREAEGRYERSKAHELQGKGNATGKLVEGELPDDAAERKALMDQALADRRKERLCVGGLLHNRHNRPQLPAGGGA